MKHSLVRQTIVETATNLFYQQGYNLTGINEIIKEAGVAKATLYNHFKSKEDICLAYLNLKNERFVKEIKAFVNSKEGGNDKVLMLFDFLKGFFKDKDFNGCWCINTVSQLPKENELVRKEIQQQKADFIDWIGTLLSDTGCVTAKQVYLLYESAVSESHLHQESWPIDEAKELCRKILD